MSTGVVQVSFTIDRREAAERIVDGLVSDGWVACGQIDGPLRSTYRWQGAVETSEEWRATLKTAASAAARVVARIRAEHHYDSPEVLVVAVAGGDSDYLQWVLDESSASPLQPG